MERRAPIRAVLDTSVLIGEHRHVLWMLAREGRYVGVWSTFIVAEVVRVRMRLSLRRGTPYELFRERINAMVHAFSEVLVVADYQSDLEPAAGR